MPQPLYYWERDLIPIVHEAGWASLERYGKFHPHWDAIPGSSSP